MTYYKANNGRYIVTKSGELNGLPFVFFAQSSSLKKAIGVVYLAYAQFKRQAEIFGD